MRMMIFAASAICLLTPALGSANMDYTKAYKATYPSAKLKVSCKVCHDGAAPKLNYYGLDYEKANHDFKAIEPFDSDGDAFINIDEINKGSLPGDKTSVPPATQ